MNNVISLQTKDTDPTKVSIVTIFCPIITTKYTN